jgi:hypothetical protein
VTAKATDLPTAGKGELRGTLFAGDLRAGIDNPLCEAKRQREPKYDPDEWNSSLVSGFDSSTENQVDFKPFRDIFFVAPFLVKINVKIISPRLESDFLTHARAAFRGATNSFPLLPCWGSRRL